MNDEPQRDPDAKPAPPSANETPTPAEQRANATSSHRRTGNGSTDEALDRLERIERERGPMYRIVRFPDGSRLIALPATCNEKLVLELMESLLYD